MATALPPIEIFRTGTFTSMEGETVTFSLADVQGIVDAYDPGVFQSPIVVGHPKTNDPAYGWVAGLSLDGDTIVAQPTDVDASFAELVEAKRFRKVSAQFWPKGHAASPRPEGVYLKHIGFLGAAAPAVKGLKPVSLSEDAQPGCITLSFALQASAPIRTTPEETPVADKPKTDADELSFAEKQAALEAREAKIAEREEALDKEAADARHAASLSFADGLVTAGKLAPAGKDQVVFVLDALGQAPDTLSFGEGEKAMSPAAAFRKLFDGAKPVVSFGEIAAPEGDQGDGSDDPSSLAEAALSYIEAQTKAGRTVSLPAAVRHVAKAK